ncbi:MAG: Hsp20/alpha crystallin family protein [Clostridia bacterium]|nr:MAG: Hsp20/alpha crystallin family protein [Clostridia bacterium]
MYVSSFNPWQSTAMAQSGLQAGMFNPVSTAWTGYPASQYLSPVSNVMVNPALQSGTFGFPAGQAIAYSFGPAMGWQQSGALSPAMTGYHTFQAGLGLAQPRIELAETNSDIVLTAELPNIDMNNLNLTVTDDSCSISALAYAPGGVSSLHRTVALPTFVKAEQVTATYNNGILEARLPKSDIAARRRIRVNPIS